MTINYTDAFVTIAATDLEKAIAFYSKLFDQQPQTYVLNVYAEFKLEFKSQSWRLAIFKPKENNKAEFSNSRNSGMNVCLEVADLSAAINHLTEMGYPPPGKIKVASHGLEIYAYDPMNNRIILHQSR
jgi:predicted enzyme related to lactoylglutathione lyase